jgi:hypothetical protein
MENELMDPENREKRPAEKIQPAGSIESGVSENDDTLEIAAAFSINILKNNLSGKLPFSAKLLPFHSEEPVLMTQIQMHQEWALAKLKALSGSGKFIQ